MAEDSESDSEQDSEKDSERDSVSRAEFRRGLLGGAAESSHPIGAHRARRRPAIVKRTPVKRIGRGQFRAVLELLPEREAEIMNFKWGFADGQLKSVQETAEQFSLAISEIETLESKALNMVSDF